MHRLPVCVLGTACQGARVAAGLLLSVGCRSGLVSSHLVRLLALALASHLTPSSLPCRAALPLPQKIGKRADDISVVSIMPCVRKQGEADRMMFHTPDGAAR